MARRMFPTALVLCSAHHRMVHQGWSVTGDPNGELVFHRPDGSVVGSSRPRLKTPPG